MENRNRKGFKIIYYILIKTESSGTTKNSNLYIRGNNDYPLKEKINLNTTLSDKIYIYGPMGLIAFEDATATYFLIKDHLGSTRVLFKSVGSQYTTYDYSPFGSLMRATINGDVIYKFTGQEFDSETGLYNFRARLYDDELGIFYAVDPAGQGFSPYMYCGGNPVIYVDKDGRFWFLAVAFITNYLMHGLTTDNWGWDAIKSGLIGAGTSFIGFSAGANISSFLASSTSLSATTINTISGAVGGSIAGGFSSMWNGKGFENGLLSGAISGGLGGLSGSYIKGDRFGDYIGSTINGAIIGGITSELTGGNFLNGAMSGAAGAATSLGVSALGEYVVNRKAVEQELHNLMGDEIDNPRRTNDNMFDEFNTELAYPASSVEMWNNVKNINYKEPLLGKMFPGPHPDYQEVIRIYNYHIRYSQGILYPHRDLFNININPLAHGIEFLWTLTRGIR